MIDKDRPLIYTAQSKQFFYCRDAVCEFVFSKDAIPLNPFRVFDYFLNDRVERDAIRDGNRRLIQVSSEVWVFGDTLADGVIMEIALARRYTKPIKYFTIENRATLIRPIEPTHVRFEEEVLQTTGLAAPEIHRRLFEGSCDSVVSALGRTRQLSGT